MSSSTFNRANREDPMRKILMTIVALVAFAIPAQAQSAAALADSMRQSIARCSSDPYTIDSSALRVYINDHCAKVQFQALQSYIDAANQCINSKIVDGPSCKEAQIIEKSLIKTLSPPAKAAKK